MDQRPPLPLLTLPDSLPIKPRVAYLITNSEIGGAQTHVADLLCAMRGQVDAVLLAGGDGPLFELASRLGITAIRLGTMDNALSPFKAMMALRELLNALRQVTPDVIHTHSAKASAIGRLAGRLLGIPVVYTVHGFAFKRAAPWKQRTAAHLTEWLLAPLTHQLICVSEAERSMAMRLPMIPDSRISVIPNGIADIDTSARADASRPFRRIVSVMRLAQPKRADLLIQALAAARLENCELIIAGDGPQRGALERLANQLAPGRVRFAGNVDNVPALLSTAQAFVLASDHEGLPISILEAMRAGLPVVASDLPGIRSQLAHGECGILLPNDPQAFSDALRNLANDAAQRVRLARAARGRWEDQYGLEPMVRATREIYQKVLTDGRQMSTRVSQS